MFVLIRLYFFTIPPASIFFCLLKNKIKQKTKTQVVYKLGMKLKALLGIFWTVFQGAVQYVQCRYKQRKGEVPQRLFCGEEMLVCSPIIYFRVTFAMYCVLGPRMDMK